LGAQNDREVESVYNAFDLNKEKQEVRANEDLPKCIDDINAVHQSDMEAQTARSTLKNIENKVNQASLHIEGVLSNDYL
jgi:hypothetical protein